jgi:hypothetical protein
MNTLQNSLNSEGTPLRVSTDSDQILRHRGYNTVITEAECLNSGMRKQCFYGINTKRL